MQICDRDRIGRQPLRMTMTLKHPQQELSMGKQRGPGEDAAKLIGQLAAKGVAVESGTVLSAAATDDLLAISGRSQKEVERLVAEAYRRLGYQVDALGGGAAAAEAGMLLTKAAQRVLLQCKYWKTRKIAEQPVRELYGVMAAHNANAGILVTTGSITLEASRFAGFGRIQLIDGPRLLAMLRQNGAAQQPAEPAQRTHSGAR
jgi:restriction endonuclease Mrr